MGLGFHMINLISGSRKNRVETKKQLVRFNDLMEI